VKIIVLGVRGMPNIPGGVETHAEQLYPRLAQLGCEVEVLVRTPFAPRRRASFGSVRLRRIWCPKQPGVEALVHSILGVLYAGLARPDILHVHAVGPALVTPIARLFGLRVVVTHHGADYERDKWGAFMRWGLRLGECVGMRFSHGRIAVSQIIMDLIRVKYHRESALIFNGAVIHEPVTEDEHVKRFGLASGRYFLQVSRVVPEKRQLDLISAYVAAQPTAWRLALVGGIGSDAYSEKVKKAASAAGVVLTGALTGKALEQLYSHAGAFVLPSSHEGLPIALLEALGYGLPVLASDIPANLEVALEESCYFPVGSVSMLADKLAQLASEPSSEVARAARRSWVAKKYDWDRIAALTYELYRRLDT
jgi:glycosyltransferase involved in cell wall biosynthesis